MPPAPSTPADRTETPAEFCRISPLAMELPTVYAPDATESKWYDFWESRGYFAARPDAAKKPFTV
ncbi:MAG TPA: hypothetical protein PKZ00_07815, partial [Elusimicrobiota bacterium]|nr:hypothetical protein [Elusimicrobiota bacterium]